MRDGVRNRRWRESMRGKPGERLKRKQNKGESKKEEAETKYRGGGGDERNRVNICVLVFSSPLVFINFTSLIHRLLHRKPSSLAQSPFACLSFLLPIPLFLLASNPSASSLTPATCDFLCIVSFSLFPLFLPPSLSSFV